MRMLPTSPGAYVGTPEKRRQGRKLQNRRHDLADRLVDDRFASKLQMQGGSAEQKEANAMTTERNQRDDTFTTATAGLPEAIPTRPERLHDGAVLRLHIGPVTKRIDDAVLRMLAYNQSIPGPTLQVDQGSEITVDVQNDGDEMTTVHWHGLRLENRFDGVPHDTQAPIPIGGNFTYKVQFPDAGVYWYHPHLREDFGQEMGLYGAIVVKPADESYWPAVDREITLTLDDVLIEGGQIAEFKKSVPTHTAMGRFGNVLLINGETRFSGEARQGDVVRLYLINTANTRIFNFAIGGARLKLVGGDSGRYERETFVEEVLIAPSERAVVDVRFDEPGEARLEHRTPDKVYHLGSFSVRGSQNGRPADSFETLRADPELSRERESLEPDFRRPPDKTLAFVASMPLLYGGGAGDADSYVCPMHPDVTATEPASCPKCGMKLIPAQPTATTATSYVCPMHADVTATEPAKCPKCGMKLIVAQATATTAASYVCPMHPDVMATEPANCPKCGMKLIVAPATAQATVTSYRCPMHPDVIAAEPGTCPKCGMKLIAAQGAGPVAGAHEDPEQSAGHGDHGSGDGIEWEDLMPEINRASEPGNMRWMIIDRETGAENAAISWEFRVGDRVKIRLVNEMESDHPMHHPFHVHGAGRFLVLSRNSQPEQNLVWKDTVLVRMGETVDILLDVSSPGLWMAHCHIAEHAESGMMFNFNVRSG
jgi:FtsP/CotA-like multicopper oxidase with cupredoxin domain